MSRFTIEVVGMTFKTKLQQIKKTKITFKAKQEDQKSKLKR
jgi:hypothetical protein